MNIQLKTILTPKKFVLNGLYFGPPKPENIFVLIHGLGGNMFRYQELIGQLVSKKDAVLAFNNRGSEIISKVMQLDKKSDKGFRRHYIGKAHEIFTDCIDDISGAVSCANEHGPKNIFLIGHSTGCQKSVYYLAKKKANPVKGAILLAPMSDFADAYSFTDPKLYNKAVSHARKMMDEKRGHELMPNNIWPDILSAQRFLSLHTSESTEEIFSYATDKSPKILKAVKKPILVILAEEDEFRDRPITEIAEWFKANCSPKKTRMEIINGSQHRFGGHIDELATIIRKWEIEQV